MIRLVEVNYPVHVAPASEVALTDEDMRVLHYIAGYLLQRCAIFEWCDFLKRSPEEGTFTNLVDRGGLVYASDVFFDLVKLMELAFRGLPSTSVSKELFLAQLQQFDFSTRFNNIFLDQDAATEQKDFFFNRITNLFFLVRVHQKCKYLLSAHGTSRKSTKPLRDTL